LYTHYSGKKENHSEKILVFMYLLPAADWS